MKKIKKVGLLLSMLGAVGFSFIATGCSGDPVINYVDHEHSYADTISHDENCHFYAATCEHTDIVKDKGYHEYTAETVAPTCTEAGYTTYTCDTCGYSYKGDEVSALGHDWKNMAGQTVTCIDAGWDAYRICKRCGESEQQIKPATDHTYSSEWANDDEYHWHAGSCIHEDLEGDKAEHTFSGGRCSVCNAAEKMVITYSQVTDYYKVDGVTDGYMVTGVRSVADNELVIPATHEGKPVVAIANGAFAGKTNITSVVLPTSVKKLGLGVFDGCTSLSEINLDSVKSIGEQCFAGCTSLQSITIPSAITEIPAYTFMNCTSLYQISILGAVTAIQLQAFYGCTAITEFSLPDTLTYIGQSAFERSGLTSITVPENVTGIASQAFRNCAALQTAVISSHVDFAADAWFSGCKALTTLTVPFVGSHADGTENTKTDFGFMFGTKQYEGSTAVEQNGVTYYIPTGLTTVTVTGCRTTRWVSDSNPNDPRTFGTVFANSFENCTMIQNVTFGADINKIEANAFKGCTGLTSATFSNTSGWTAGGTPMTVTVAADNATALTGGNLASEWVRA